MKSFGCKSYDKYQIDMQTNLSPWHFNNLTNLIHNKQEYMKQKCANVSVKKMILMKQASLPIHSNLDKL